MDVPEPPFLPSIYDWFEKSLAQSIKTPFITLTAIKEQKFNTSDSAMKDPCPLFTPRTALFQRLFKELKPRASSVETVEALHCSGFTAQVLDTLPEAILVPFREALTDCQSRPQISWGRALLSLVGREDVNVLLFPEQKERLTHALLLVRMAHMFAWTLLTSYRLKRTRRITTSTQYAQHSRSRKL